MSVSLTNVARWVLQNFYTKTQLTAGTMDTRYFAESEFITTSAGAGDVGKPIKLDAGGHIDATMINDADIDHGTIGGLGDDDHTQYALLAGRSGGQSLTGGTASGNNLTLLSTSHGTKGKILLGTGSAYDQVNDRLGVKTASPSRALEAAGTIKVSGTDATFTTDGWGKALEFPESYVLQWLRSGASVSRALGFNPTGTLYFMRSTASDNSAAPTYDMTLDASGNLNVTGTITQSSVAVVTTTGSQTLTNKTLTAPTIGATEWSNANHTHAGATTGGTIAHTALTSIGTNTHAQIDSHIAATTEHGATGAVVGTTNTQTLTNKTLTTPSLNGDTTQLTIKGATNANKQLLVGYDVTSDYGTIQAVLQGTAYKVLALNPGGGDVVVGGSTTDHNFEVQDAGASNFRVTVNLNYGGTNYLNSYNGAVGALTGAPLAIVGSTLTFTGMDHIILTSSKTPASAAAAGTQGSICWDASYIYVCTASNTWKRAAIATW